MSTCFVLCVLIGMGHVQLGILYVSPSQNNEEDDPQQGLTIGSGDIPIPNIVVAIEKCSVQSS